MMKQRSAVLSDTVRSNNVHSDYQQSQIIDVDRIDLDSMKHVQDPFVLGHWLQQSRNAILDLRQKMGNAIEGIERLCTEAEHWRQNDMLHESDSIKQELAGWIQAYETARDQLSDWSDRVYVLEHHLDHVKHQHAWAKQQITSTSVLPQQTTCQNHQVTYH